MHAFKVSLAAVALLLPNTAHAAEQRLLSPDGKVEVVVSDAGGANLSVTYHGTRILESSALGLELDPKDRVGEDVVIVDVDRRKVDDSFDQITGKISHVDGHGQAVLVTFRETHGARRKLAVEIRAYDDGVAFRYRLPEQPGVTAPNLAGELTSFRFAGDYGCRGLNNGAFGTNHEGEFDPVRASLIREHHLFDAPLLCDAGPASFAILEAGVRDWPSMNLTGRGDGRLGVTVRLTPSIEDNHVAVRTRAGGPTVSPWRVVLLGDTAGKLFESNLVSILSDPPAPGDLSWIKPGKAAWDWWNGPSLRGVAEPGMNVATMTRFIDFAAAQGLPYMLIDEGWHAGAGGGGDVRPGADVTRPLPELDLRRLVSYAAGKGVGLWLWVNWRALDAHLEEALALYERLGIKGVKIDFMNRDDQAMNAWYLKLLEAASRHHLMVDLHGVSHPTGLSRTYPNLLTQEGVMGAEYNKWSRRVTATHNVTLAYTRMLAGPMDYTPGGFRNVTPAAFEPRNLLPMVQTTRGHGLAMYVVYESALGLVSDSPDTYAGSPDGLDAIRTVPVTWDETRFLAGTPGSHVVVARRKGAEWWIGAMGNEQARDVSIPLSFLAGRADAQIIEDGPRPDTLKRSRRTVGPGDTIRLRLAPSGGALVRLRPAG